METPSEKSLFLRADTLLQPNFSPLPQLNHWLSQVLPAGVTLGSAAPSCLKALSRHKQKK